jgi:archaellum component FlaC
MDDLAVVETFDGTIEVEGMTVVVEAGQITEVMEGEMPEGTEEELQVEGEMPNATYATPEEVSQMIDVRFAEIMEEITRIKSMMDGQTEELKKTIDEKFKTTPAVESIKKSNIDEKFKSVEERVKAFAKIK